MENKLYDYLASIIKKNIGDRKLRFWGEQKEIMMYFDKVHGLKVDAVITVDPKKVNDKDVLHFDTVLDRNSEFYIFVPFLPGAKVHYDKIELSGYKEISDFLFLIPFATFVPTGNYSTIPYMDIHGNVVSGVVKGVRIKLVGYGSNIKLGVASRLNNLAINVQSFASLTFLENVEFGLNSNIHLWENAALFLGVNFRTRKENTFVIQKNAQCIIKDNTTFESNNRVVADDGRIIEIGKDCMVSYEVTIRAGDGHAIFDIKSGKRTNLSDKDVGIKKIIIGDHVWLGQACTILEKTVIGNGSIVGTRSVVKTRVPNNCAIGGFIAKIIRRDVAWARDNATLDIGKCGAECINLTQESEE